MTRTTTTPALQTLEPRTGIARGFALIAPDAQGTGLWKALVDIGIGEVSDYPLAAVGAYDLTRRGALERGAGEAVERFALAGSAHDVARGPEQDPGTEEQIWWPRWVDVDPDADAGDVAWYRAERLADGSPILVPAPVVDDHGGRRQGETDRADRAFDPSPSGAASGLDRESAARAALLEVIERDAVLCAWATRTGAEHLEPPADDGVDLLRREAARLGLAPRFVRVDARVPGVTVVGCAIVDAQGPEPLVGFGAKASASVVEAVRGALQEALQIHELLGNLRRMRPRPAEFDEPEPLLVVDDVSRAWWWTTARASRHMEDWIRSWDTGTRDVAAVRAEPPTAATLVAAIVRDGGDPLLVDLSHRLPVAARDLGWRVVKVLCPGYQQLRLDESLDRTWDDARLRHWARAERPPGDDARALPHPLI